MLESEGYQTYFAGDGKEALEKNKKHSPEVILLDVKLPFMNGIEVLEEIRRDNRNSIVIMLTGYADLKDAVKAIKLGAYDYITKPFSNDDIVSNISEALESYRTSRNMNLPPISKREKEVLKWLRKGKSSWDVSVILEISERTVNFHINNVMKKLDSMTRTQAVATAVENGLIEVD
jgi:DNA-binding NarL/FixJ family response regulator